MRNRWSGVVILSAAVVSWGCIPQRCLRDADCPGGQVCRPADGACAEPECSTAEECGAGRICQHRFCIAGCLEDDDCGPTERCVEQRCRAIGSDCPCPLAPVVAGKDLNPRSPTFESEVYAPRDFPGGVALFFGSIYCGHCTSILTALWQRKLELEAEGLQPRLIWIQVGRFPATSESVSSIFDEAWDFPVLQDDEAGSLWEAYHADWYHFVMIDTHGCTDASRHFGPLDATTLYGEAGDEIAGVWREALSDACREASEDAGD
ncbi:MAG: hypothetical protein GYA57_20785 [Myxococcales bacterium]|nr:hypothetical protein [Myxococcales bacterium]